MSKKTNPKKIPRTQADVDKAYSAGMIFGVEFAINMVLFVLKDKHDAPDEDLKHLKDEFMYACDSVETGYLKYPDIKRVLSAEYDISVNFV